MPGHPFNSLRAHTERRCMSPVEIGRRLRIARQLSGIHMKQAAGLVDRSISAVCLWETGKRPMDVMSLQCLCSLYGITVPDLFAPEFPGGCLNKTETGAA